MGRKDKAMDKAKVNIMRFYAKDWKDWQWELKWKKVLRDMVERGLKKGAKN